MGVEIERKWLLDTVSGSVCKFAFKTCAVSSLYLRTLGIIQS